MGNSGVARMSRAILYIRVSSRRQAEEGFSLSHQRKRLELECRRRKIRDYVVIADEGESAGSLDRPGIREALELLASGERDLLMVVKLDRLCRSVQDTLDVAELQSRQGWNIVILDGAVTFDTTSPHGRFALTMFAAMAQWEREIIRERTRATFAEMRRDEEVGLIPPATEALIVLLYRKRQYSMRVIADVLNRRGIETAKGGKWYASTVAKVLDRHDVRTRSKHFRRPRDLARARIARASKDPVV